MTGKLNLFNQTLGTVKIEKKLKNNVIWSSEVWLQIYNVLKFKNKITLKKIKKKDFSTSVLFTGWARLIHHFGELYCMFRSFSGNSVLKNPPANAGNTGLIPGSEISLGEGNGNSLQYACLENSMDRKALQTIVHGITKSQI